MAEKQIGKITHFFDKAQVAVVRLSDGLSTGDKIKVAKGDKKFDDVVSSMQIDKKPISSAKAGEEVAVKLSQAAGEGWTVYKEE